MGRIKIKKKNAVLPFRETVAYRFMIVAAAFLLFVVAVYELVVSIQASDTRSLILGGVLAAGALLLGIYNLSQMQQAKVPRRTLQKMKRYRGR